MQKNPKIGPHLKYATKGQKVWTNDGKGNLVTCRITIAAGNHAKVTHKCDQYQIDAWRDITDLQEYIETKKT